MSTGQHVNEWLDEFVSYFLVTENNNSNNNFLIPEIIAHLKKTRGCFILVYSQNVICNFY